MTSDDDERVHVEGLVRSRDVSELLGLLLPEGYEVGERRQLERSSEPRVLAGKVAAVNADGSVIVALTGPTAPTAPSNAYWMVEMIDTVRALAADLEQVAVEQPHTLREARFLTALQAALRDYDDARGGGKL
jgi:hypothetical protein